MKMVAPHSSSYSALQSLESRRSAGSFTFSFQPLPYLQRLVLHCSAVQCTDCPFSATLNFKLSTFVFTET